MNRRRLRDSAVCISISAALGFSIAAADPYARLDTLARVLSDVEDQYEQALSLDTLVNAALHGIVGALDEHSGYFTREEWRAAQARASGPTVGVGLTLQADSCGLRVQLVDPLGPSAALGIAGGDCIVSIDGVPTSASTPQSALDGPDGSAVRVGVASAGASREVAILRGHSAEPAVSSALLADGTLHIRVRNFVDPVAAMVNEQLHSAKLAKAVILDLRGNPGGRVEEAVSLVDRFVSSGVIVTTKRRVGGNTELRATAAETDLLLPLVVLVDGDTASAAEIVAGALRDLKRAQLVGRTTYGKGSVQNVVIYEDGSALKITVGRYFLPSGAPILDHAGLVPDVLVAISTGDLDAARAALKPTPKPR